MLASQVSITKNQSGVSQSQTESRSGVSQSQTESRSGVSQNPYESQSPYESLRSRTMGRLVLAYFPLMDQIQTVRLLAATAILNAILLVSLSIVSQTNDSSFI